MWDSKGPCRGRHLEIVKYLIDHKAPLKGALEIASREGDFEIVKYLVEHGQGT